jgi:hypothetical protein
MIILVKSRDGKGSLSVDLGAPPRDSAAVMVNGKAIGQEFYRLLLKSLHYFVMNANEELTVQDFRSKVWENRDSTDRTIRHGLNRVRALIGEEWFDCNNGYKFVGTITPDSKLAAGKLDQVRFSFLIDGMILDIVGELLMHDDSMVPIINRSRGTYQRGLEDFAFSLVYAESITSPTDILDRSHDPGRYSRADITAQLGQLWHFHRFGSDLKNGAILDDDGTRELVRRDIEAAGRCIVKNGWPFRDWLFGEVPRHLGEHPSLAEDGLPREQFVFKVDEILRHYRDPGLQDAFGEDAANLAVGFLREATRNSALQYTAPALREFATASVVSLVTIMRENDTSAERNKIWRMPHLLRSLVKQEALFRKDIQHEQQLHLRRIITQHALSSALRDVQEIERRSLITVLLNMRDAYPFRNIRTILQAEQLVLSNPTEANELKAERILKEIAKLSNAGPLIRDRFSLSGRNVLRELSTVKADRFEPQLYRVFPALRPALPVRLPG